MGAALGRWFPALDEITAPGTVDGGDVMRAGRRLFVGRSARTNDAGVAQLRALARSADYEVIPVDFQGCLHLKTAATLVAPGLAIVNPEWVSPAALAPLDTIAVDPAEPMAANALLVGDEVIFPAEFPRTRARLEGAGIRVRTVPAGELAKAEGGVTCCSIIVGARVGAS
jgi:dimethylargininase